MVVCRILGRRSLSDHDRESGSYIYLAGHKNVSLVSFNDVTDDVQPQPGTLNVLVKPPKGFEQLPVMLSQVNAGAVVFNDKLNQ